MTAAYAPTPTAMPTQRTLPTNSHRRQANYGRPHSIARFLTRSGLPAGETKVWREITDWIAFQVGRGWHVRHHDTDTGAAYLEHPDGRTCAVDPRAQH